MAKTKKKYVVQVVVFAVDVYDSEQEGGEWDMLEELTLKETEDQEQATLWAKAIHHIITSK